MQRANRHPFLCRWPVAFNFAIYSLFGNFSPRLTRESQLGSIQAMDIYAHSDKEKPEKLWELLYGSDGHAERTRKVIESFASLLAPELWPSEEATRCMRLLALAHDMGKASHEWQQYLRDSARGRPAAKVDHKTAAAKWALENIGGPMGVLLAYAFAGHHSGLPNGVELFAKLRDFELAPEVVDILPEELRGNLQLSLPKLGHGQTMAPGAPRAVQNAMAGECAMLLSMVVRMLHSSLIDADWTATAQNSGERPEGLPQYTPFVMLSEKLEERLQKIEREGKNTRINALRQKIHEACYTAAERKPAGMPIYRLNVPTGGGKTLSSLSFALRHAVLCGKQRVIYVIPFTSIIEQTARQFRGVLGAGNVLEHHSNVSEENDNEENRRASESWDAPVIVTTSVQFFESLFSDENRRCRKLHNIAQSVIIFDEAQTLPTHLLAPCIAAMKALQYEFGCTLVLCTATQPAFTRDAELFPIGWDASESRSLIGEELETRLQQEMKRVEVENIGRKNKEELVNHFLSSGNESALFIVNLTRQAQELFSTLRDRGVGNVYHLSARMCSAHRAEVLQDVCDRLKNGKPTVLVATRVVEAGVDISFPVVYRDKCGLDSLAQSAGRCNRHGELPMGKVFYFDDPDSSLSANMADLRDGFYVLDDILRDHSMKQVFEGDVVKEYFRRFYARMQDRNWDEKEIMPLIGQSSDLVRAWDFPGIAEKFRIIPEGQHSLIIPYGDAGEKLRSRLLELQRLKLMPTREDYREIQRFSVSVYDQEWRNIPREPVHEAAGLFMLADAAWYDKDCGLLREPPDCNYVF